jgi:hypothetical protein
MQRPLTNYGNAWGVDPYSRTYGVQPYVGPFGGLGAPGDAGITTETPGLSNTILQLVAAGLIGGMLVAAAAPSGKSMERGLYGAGLAAGSVAVVNGFILGFKESQPGLGVGIGLMGVLVTWMSYTNAKRGGSSHGAGH